MTKITKPEVMKLITLAAIIDKRQASVELVDLWHTLIGGNTYQEAHDALIEHMKESSFPPHPSDINNRVKKALFRHQELYGIHPAPPEGKQWAADVIDSSPRLEVEK